MRCVQPPPFKNDDYDLLEYNKELIQTGQQLAHFFNETGWEIGTISAIQKRNIYVAYPDEYPHKLKEDHHGIYWQLVKAKDVPCDEGDFWQSGWHA